MRYVRAAGWAVGLLALVACGEETDAAHSAGNGREPLAMTGPQPDAATAAGSGGQAGGPPAPAPPTPPPTPPSVTGSATAGLTGTWAGDIESCNGGEAVSFFADGTYGMEGEGGRWRLNGTRLVLSGITQFEMGEAGEVAVPDRSLGILELTDETLVWRAADGFEARFRRCPG